jgi:hypothetical protein
MVSPPSSNIDNAFALLAGIAISGISAWYSIIGLTAIFAGAFWSIIIMGATLEVGKIITASYLYRNRKSLSIPVTGYFISAVLVLMLITSMGTFGYLSRAHIEQAAGAQNVDAQLERIDQSIARERERIVQSEGILKQLDASINSLIDQKHVILGLEARRKQEAERRLIADSIREYQTNIDKLRDEKMPLQQAIRDAKREVGPVRYVAELIYGASDTEIMDKSIRWIIILLVLVLDPLAVLLIMVSTQKYTASPPMSKTQYAKWLRENANAVATNGIEWNDMGVIITKTKPKKK